jgi:3-oxoacyl-[acyl-carrier-protein] synthase II
MGEELGNLHIMLPFLAPCCEEESGLEAAFLQEVKEHYDGRRSLWAAPEATGAALASRYGIQGPVRTHLTACAASAQAFGEAFHAIAEGEICLALAGGTHGMVHPDGIMAFSKLGALSTRNDFPEAASRPFDATREGFVMGEGAAILILESEEHLLARGGVPRVEVLGYGVSADGFRVTDPDPSGVQVARSIELAMQSAGISPEDVDYINAHGTSTQANDSIETKAIHMALGEAADRVPVSSIKSMIGHLIAAAGAIEAVTCYQSILEGRIAPTINLENPDPVCDLDYVSEGAREVEVKVALSNSFGFGGQNVCLVLGQARP